METFRNLWQSVVRFFETGGWTVVTFLAALTLGILVIRILKMILKKLLLKSPVENTLSGFISTVASALMWLLLIFILCLIAKIPLTPLVTALGAVVIAIGLAIKDNLANLANGVVLIGTKPFKVGDFVDIEGIAGTVKAIHMMTTEILTVDNKKITVPNSKITMASVINFSAKPTRRVDWYFTVAYGTKVDKAKRVLSGIVNRHEKVFSVPNPVIRLYSFEESSLKFVVRAWVASADYWDVYFDVNEQIAAAFEKSGIEIPFNQLDVHLKDGFAGACNNADKAAPLCEGQGEAPAGARDGDEKRLGGQDYDKTAQGGAKGGNK